MSTRPSRLAGGALATLTLVAAVVGGNAVTGLAAPTAQVAPAGLSAPHGLSAPAGLAAPAASPGYCRDDDGVTVVVDFSALGGNIVVRCAAGPLPAGYTGLEALAQAGFSVTGTQRWGPAFVCRIQGRPTADEPLDIDGADDYRERCLDTPPTSAFWGYWYADDGGSWTYSSGGAAGRTVNEGGFEGWSFSLNDAVGANPPPGIEPDRPGVAEDPEEPQSSSPLTSSAQQPSPTRPSTPTIRPDEGSPTSSSPDDGPTRGGGGRSDDAPTLGETSTSPPTTSSEPTRSDRPTGPSRPGSPSQGVGSPTRIEPGSGPSSTPTGPTSSSESALAPTETSDSVLVTGDLPSDPASAAAEGPSAGLVVGAGVLGLLAAGAGVTAWRRQRRG